MREALRLLVRRLTANGHRDDDPAALTLADRLHGTKAIRMSEREAAALAHAFADEINRRRTE